MGHTSLVTHNSGQMDGLLGVILLRANVMEGITIDGFSAHLRERLDFSSVTGSTFPGKEAKGAMARRFVLDDQRPTSVVSQGIHIWE
jgi:hypothetical protein